MINLFSNKVNVFSRYSLSQSVQARSTIENLVFKKNRYVVPVTSFTFTLTLEPVNTIRQIIVPVTVLGYVITSQTILDLRNIPASPTISFSLTLQDVLVKQSRSVVSGVYTLSTNPLVSKRSTTVSPTYQFTFSANSLQVNTSKLVTTNSYTTAFNNVGSLKAYSVSVTPLVYTVTGYQTGYNKTFKLDRIHYQLFAELPNVLLNRYVTISTQSYNDTHQLYFYNLSRTVEPFTNTLLFNNAVGLRGTTVPVTTYDFTVSTNDVNIVDFIIEVVDPNSYLLTFNNVSLINSLNRPVDVLDVSLSSSEILKQLTLVASPFSLTSSFQDVTPTYGRVAVVDTNSYSLDYIAFKVSNKRFWGTLTYEATLVPIGVQIAANTPLIVQNYDISAGVIRLQYNYGVDSLGYSLGYSPVDPIKSTYVPVDSASYSVTFEDGFNQFSYSLSTRSIDLTFNSVGVNRHLVIPTTSVTIVEYTSDVLKDHLFVPNQATYDLTFSPVDLKYQLVKVVDPLDYVISYKDYAFLKSRLFSIPSVPLTITDPPYRIIRHRFITIVSKSLTYEYNSFRDNRNSPIGSFSLSTTTYPCTTSRVYYSIIPTDEVFLQFNQILLKKQSIVPISSTSVTLMTYQASGQLGVSTGGIQTAYLNTSFSEVLVTKQWSSGFIDTLPFTATILGSVGSYRNLEKTRYNTPRIYLIL